MKKYISALALSICFFGAAYAQETETTEAQQELQAIMDEGLVKFKTEDGKFSFRVGARVDIDGAHYIDDYTDRSSGANFSAARIRMYSKLGDKLDFKMDLDFATKNIMKDVYLRWHSNKNGFLRVGNFAEAFSAENIQSTMDYPFINKSATVETFGTGRSLGLAYRYYHPYFWGEAGVYSQKYNKEHKAGDMGYGVSTRLLGRITRDDWNVHIGGSVNYRRPDANGFTNGNDDYNRSVTIGSPLETSIDNTKFIGATLNNVKSVLRYGGEVMANYKRVYVKGEYIGATYDRERDWDYSFTNSLGSVLSTMFPTLDAYKKLMGEDEAAKFSGYSIEAGVIAIGGDYKYNSVDALMRRPKGKTLEIVARYNHTDLNDILPGSWYYNGGFYSSSLHQAFGIRNQSVSGGKVDTFTLGINYYITNNIVTRLNYSYQKLNQEYNRTFREDKNLHSIQARLAFEF